MRDDGPGIPPEVREALLAPRTLGVRRAGAGLGLLIVRRILELHGSRIELESSEHGTRVRFDLAAARVRSGNGASAGVAPAGSGARDVFKIIEIIV